MSGLAIVWGSDRSRMVSDMLERIGHRGGNGDLITMDKGCIGLSGLSSGSGMAMDLEDGGLAVDGWVESTGDGADQVADLITNRLQEEGPEVLGHMPGEYAIAVANGDELLVARDEMGVKPLYAAELNGKEMMFASEIKAFPEGAVNIRSVPAGGCISTRSGLVRQPVEEASRVSDMRLDMLAGSVMKKLRQAVVRRLPDGEEDVGLFLSGGLDSSVIAALLAEQSRHRVQAFAVGMAGSPDLIRAQEVAEHLEMPITVHELDVQEMLSVLPDVVYHLESFDCFLVRSATANYIVAKLAAEAGLKVVFCGEGADELFGGYDYLKDLTPAEARVEMKELLGGLSGNGLQRVDRMTQAHGLEARVPYLDCELVKFAGRIPFKYKIYGPEKVEKYVLRRAFAGRLPENVLWRGKDKFYEGSGCGDTLSKAVEGMVSDKDERKFRSDIDKLSIRSREELYYYMRFREYFPGETVKTVVRTRTVVA